MKIRYSVLLFFVVIFVSYWFVDARVSSYENDGNYIADYYMPLVRVMDTFEDVVEHEKKQYKMVVAYVYRLTDEQQKPVGSVDQKTVYSDAYTTVNDTYNIIQRYVEQENDRFDAAGPQGVKFVGVNLFHGNMDELTTKYNLGRVPTLLFFRDGKLEAQEPIGRTFTTAQLKDFLTKAKFFDFLDDETQRYQAKEAREQRRERRSRRRYYYGGWGSPYYGGGYYGGYGWRGYGWPGYYGYYGRPYGGFYVGW